MLTPPLTNEARNSNSYILLFSSCALDTFAKDFSKLDWTLLVVSSFFVFA
jgi:hypothetical protein